MLKMDTVDPNPWPFVMLTEPILFSYQKGDLAGHCRHVKTSLVGSQGLLKQVAYLFNTQVHVCVYGECKMRGHFSPRSAKTERITKVKCKTVVKPALRLLLRV